MKNKYIIRSRISEAKFREIVRLFCIDIEASKVACITKVSRPTINTLFTAIRKRISEDCERFSPFAKGEIEQAAKETSLFTDGFRTYDGLADLGYKKHHRIKHSTNEFATGGYNHINGIENFWGLCKVRLSRFRGIHKHKFYYHLKECEFRFNMKAENMYQYLLNLFRKKPLKLS